MDTNAEGDRTLSFHLTTTRITVGILGIQTVLLALVGLSVLGVAVPVVREVLAVLYITVVPGFLVLQLLGVTPEQRLEYVLYAIGVSLIVLMVLGVIFNFGLRFSGVPNPVSEVPMILSVSAAMIALTGMYYRHTNQHTSVTLTPARLVSPLWLSLALMPFLGVYGAHALTVYDTNILLLGLFAVVALIPVLVLYDIVPTEAWPVVLWAVALSLLLQNTLTGEYLAWGDQPKEATLGLTVLAKGFWDPSLPVVHGNKFAMLRIVLLHPMYALFSDLDIVWIFKLVHPVLFSITPVILYQTYQKFTSRTIAFLSAYLYMSLFSFFVVLSRNTRTATALLFLAFLGLIIVDDSIHDQRAKLLAILFGLSMIVSHYGVSYITMAALPLVVLLRPLLDRLTGDGDAAEVHSRIRTRDATTSIAFVGAYVTGTLAWYVYVSPNSTTFNTLVRYAEHFVMTLRSQFISASVSSTTQIVTNNWQSSTLEVLKYYNVGIGVLIAIGLGATLSRRYFAAGNHRTINIEYVTYALVFFGLFGMTFLPVDRFNTARTYPTSLIFFAPFFVIGIGKVITVGNRLLSFKFTADMIVKVATVILLIYFLLNAGFVSATVSHEQSPNVLVEKDRVMQHGRPAEKAYFYKQYLTVYDGAGTEWLRANVEGDVTVYTSLWPGNPRIPVGYEGRYGSERLRHPSIQPIPDGELIHRGYVYLGAFSSIGNVVTVSGETHRWAYTSDIQSQWAHKNKVYDNGGAGVYR